MHQQKRAKYPGRMKWRQPLFFFRNTLLLLIMAIVIGVTILLSFNFAFPNRLNNLLETTLTGKTMAITTANQWENDQSVTAPNINFSLPSPHTVSVSTLFERYYHSQNRAESLGEPVTAAFPTQQGWLQFFESGALLLPSAQQTYFHNADDPLSALIDNATKDPNTGIIRLPLIQALLTVGSQIPIGGNGSSLTYVDLRHATNLGLMRPAPPVTASSDTSGQAIFVKGDIRNGKDVGHFIPQPLWNYINRSDISPDGWSEDFGAPLTEALSFTLTRNGSVHHMQVQAFWRDGLILDQDALDDSGQPFIQQLSTGVDYLRTIGLPTLAIHAQQPIWVQAETALLEKPNTTGRTIAHAGLNFPLTLLGDTAWNTGMLWYHVQWTALKGSGTGWVSAASTTFTSPNKMTSWAALDMLSPELASYLAGYGNNAGAVVYDVTRQRYYTSNANAQFIVASSMKVPIMLTFLDMTEHQNREPNAQELNLLTTMIENSNNDSASALYYGKIGGATGVSNYFKRIGITGLTPNPDAWGYSQITPQTMVDLLTRLSEGTILTARDRTLALSLMAHIEPDQQVGVGDTAPAGATVMMKDGWVPGPDGLWAMNSSGIVKLGQQTYILAVYTQEQPTLDDGHAIVRHVCGDIALLLTGHSK